jgi:hypothetical protein
VDDEEFFEGLGFNPTEFFQQLRKSASVKAGAIMFGQAQVAYFDSLKQGGMSQDEAFNMLAHTTECIIRGLASAVGPVSDVLLRAATIAELFGKRESDKEVPGG